MAAGPRDIADLEGVWTLEKAIEDRLGPPGTFSGQARIARNRDGWRYEESGALVLAEGRALAAERVYLWRPLADGVAIAFADGRPFHQMPFAGGSAVHACPPDAYRVTYDFDGWPDWTAMWEVRGPRKDYRMEARYLRLGP